jgi:hypothetical protein
MSGNNFRVSPNSAFKPYIPYPSPYKMFMDIIEAGEIKIATRDNEILTPAESMILFETMQVRYQEGVIKVVKK